MSIPFSEIVNVLPRTIGGGLSGQDFNMLVLSENENLPVGQVVTFYNQASVGAYLGIDSEEYKLAGVYFSADVNKQKVPSALLVARHVKEQTKAWLRGATYKGTLSKLTAISQGTLELVIDGADVELTEINLSEANSYSAVADAIQAKLQEKVAGSTVVYDSTFNAFKITGATIGNTASIGYAKDGELALLLGLCASNGAVISNGAEVTTLTAELDDVTSKNQKFVPFMTVFQETEEQGLELASWCNSKGTRFIYMYNEVSDAPTIMPDAECFAKKVKDSYGVACQYDDKNISAFLGGVIASIDWSRYEGRKNPAFKTQGGLKVTAQEKAVAENLIANGYNFFGLYGNASNELSLFYAGKISGNAKWIDTYCGQIYIADRLQNAWVSLFTNTNSVPYNNQGYTMLKASAQDVIQNAINNGVIRQGVSLSAEQASIVMAEAGLDISEELETAGYYLQVLDPSAQVRAERGTPIINLWYTDGGSVQKINATSTTIL